MERIISKGQIYKHFKGNMYKIEGIAYDSKSSSDNLKKVVIYKALYGDNKVWVRDYDDFISKVDINKYPDAKQVYRFEEVK